MSEPRPVTWCVDCDCGWRSRGHATELGARWRHFRHRLGESLRALWRLR